MSEPQPIADVSERAHREGEHAGAVRGMFDRIAGTYDLLNVALSAGRDRRGREKAVRALARFDGPVLDLCAGTLDLAALVSAARPKDRVVAADFSAAMLEAGRGKAPRVETVVADALALPFEDATFGAVVCGFGVRNLSDLGAGVREVRRVLKPGGGFVTLELFRPTRALGRAAHASYGRVVLPLVGGLVSGERRAYDYLARSMKGFASRAEYEALLAREGFARVSGEDLTLGLAGLVTAERSR